MRYIFSITLSAILLSFGVFGQGNSWNSVIDLNVAANSSDRVDLYADSYGIHIVFHKSNQLVYYLFSVDGTQIRTSVRDNFTESVRLSRIFGFGENLYIVYKKSSAIYTQKSTNGGQNWSTSAVANISLSNSNSDGIDIITDTNGLHLAYSVYNPAQAGYETYYRMVKHDESNWQDFKHVTDQTGPFGGYTGGLPSISLSNGRVHVSFTKVVTGGSYVTGDANYRERYNGVWQTTEYLFDSFGSSQSYVIPLQNQLHAFHYDHGDIPLPNGTPDYYLSHDHTNISNHDWNDNYTNLINYGTFGPPDGNYRLDITQTADNSIHFVYGGDTYKKWDGSQFIDQFTFGNGSNNKIIANNKDIYILWINNSSNTLKLRQRDFAPLAPVNLVRSISSSHPRIDWYANAEADLDEYEVWKKKGTGSWGLLATTGNDYYVDATESGVSLNPQVNNIEIKYKLKAVDLESNASGYSAEVTFNQSGGGLDKKGNPNDDALPTVFALAQNYPNPFNPSTAIRYSLPEATHVTLTVYNLSGETVATLVNGEQAAGSYDTVFDASGLPSGVYLYRLTTPVVSQSRKMMILK